MPVKGRDDITARVCPEGGGKPKEGKYCVQGVRSFWTERNEKNRREEALFSSLPLLFRS